MDLGIRGKTALIGGASQGLGRAMAHRLAAEGANLILVARNAEPLEDVRRHLVARYAVQALAVAHDLSAPDVADAILTDAASLGPIDILIHNTGGPPPGLFVDHADPVWEDAFNTLLMSVVRTVRAVLPSMIDRRWGRIVINTSFTVKEPASRLILSNVFRTAVVALAKTLSREVAADGITVNCVCPGAFETRRLVGLFEEQSTASGRPIDEVRQEWVARIPIGRVLQPEELASLVAFLVSDLAGGITGTSLPIEGGMLHGLF